MIEGAPQATIRPELRLNAILQTLTTKKDAKLLIRFMNERANWNVSRNTMFYCESESEIVARP